MSSDEGASVKGKKVLRFSNVTSEPASEPATLEPLAPPPAAPEPPPAPEAPQEAPAAPPERHWTPKRKKGESLYSYALRLAQFDRAIELWIAAWRGAGGVKSRAARALGVLPTNVPMIWSRLHLTAEILYRLVLEDEGQSRSQNQSQDQP